MSFSERLGILIALVGYYVGVRSVIFYYFIGGPSEGRQGMVDWWFSWGIAIPASAASILILSGAISFLFGVGPLR